jgi:hypothetical protein
MRRSSSDHVSDLSVYLYKNHLQTRCCLLKRSFVLPHLILSSVLAVLVLKITSHHRLCYSKCSLCQRFLLSVRFSVEFGQALYFLMLLDGSLLHITSTSDQLFPLNHEFLQQQQTYCNKL